MSNFRIYNETLCPDLWDNYSHLDPRSRVNLLRLAYDFYKKTKFQAPIKDIYLMGSSANYNWTPDSDIDVHIILSFDELRMPPETAVKITKTASAQWNNEHDVEIKGHKVELNIQNSKEQKPHITGIYSLIKDEWVRIPQKTSPHIDKAVIQAKYSGMKKYLESAVRSGNRETMKKVKDYLDALRQYGLDTCGELSVENIVFKILRSKGLIKMLKDAIVKTYDREMSVDEVGMKDLKPHLPPPENVRYTDNSNLRLDRLTMDNLIALRSKSARSIAYLKKKESPQSLDREMEKFKTYSSEIKRRLAYINKPVNEMGGGGGGVGGGAGPGGIGLGYGGDPKKDPKAVGRWTVKFDSDSKILKETRDEAADDFFRRYDENLQDLAHLLKQSKGKGRVPWAKIPAARLARIWLDYGKSGVVRDEKGLEMVVDMMLNNIARLTASTAMMGHASYDVRPELSDLGFEFTDEEWENWMSDWMTNERGSWMISDYGLPKLEKLYVNIYNSQTAEEKLQWVDQALNVVHQRNDLADMFVQGGTSTLNKIADQGGYTSQPVDERSSEEKKTRHLKRLLPYLNDELLYVTVNRDDTFPQANFVQMDVISRRGRNVLSTNPEQLKTMGYDIPTSQEFLQLQRGKYKLSNAKKMLKQELKEEFLCESPEIGTLKKNKNPLTDEERKMVMDAHATWHHGPNGEKTPAVWKAAINGKTWYVTNTHRAYQAKPTIKGAIRAFHDVIKQTS
jgi:predicted nucleotidyltransferase